MDMMLCSQTAAAPRAFVKMHILIRVGRCCISNRLLGATDATGLWTTLRSRVVVGKAQGLLRRSKQLGL